MMKKTIFATLCTALVAWAGWGCTPTPTENEPKLELSPVMTELDHTAQESELGVEANAEWTAASSEEWLTLSNDASNGADVITYEVTENTTSEMRSAEITVIMGELSATAYVEQAAPSFRVNKTELEFDYQGGSENVEVFASTAWAVKSSADWLTITSDESDDLEKTITITAEPNAEFKVRTAEITIRTEKESAVIKVTQGRQTSDNFLVNIDSEDYDAATGTLTTDIFGASYTVNVGTPSSSVVWDAKTEATYITLENNLSNMGSGSFSFKVDFNNQQGERQTTITLKGKVGTKTIELPIVVKQTYFEAQYTNTFDAQPYGDTLNMGVTIEPAMDIVYKSSADWVSFDDKGNIFVESNPEMAAKRETNVDVVLARDTTVVVGSASVLQNPLYTITIPLQCNTYVTPLDPEVKAEPSFASTVLPGANGLAGDGKEKTGGAMGNLKSWKAAYISQPHQLSFFFRTEATGELNLGMVTGLVFDDEEVADTAWLDIEIGETRRSVMITNQIETYKSGLYKDGIKTVYLGNFPIPEPGYVRVNIIPIKATGRNLPYITDFALGGEAIRNVTKKSNVLSFVDKNNIESSDPHWIMRGPSGNLSYPQPANTEYFYNEIYVDKGYDFSGGYYMTTGGSAFYMGLQPTDGQRTVLFSAWDTDTEKGWHAQVVRYGETKPNNFGHEGSGQQTFLKYNWKAETTYATMAHVRPEVDENGNQTGATLYTGYFWSEEDKDRDDETCVEGWHLVAEYRRPHEVAYYRGAHSFCENFSPYRGWIPRRVNFTNQWMIDKDGVWHEVTQATLGVDGTGGSGMRKDFSGGVDERGFFYLTNIGYIDEYGKPGTRYTREPKGKKPNIPFEKLAKLGTWVDK